MRIHEGSWRRLAVSKLYASVDLAVGLLLLLLLAGVPVPQWREREACAGETLDNGIALPNEWPPKVSDSPPPDVLATPPYLIQPPAVIPITTGRQLFVDDFLIEQTTMTRAFHKPVPYPGNPVLKPEMPWEKAGEGAMAVASSVCFDPTDGRFKMWYMTGYVRGMGLALSDDGIRWTRPNLGNGTNRVSDDFFSNVVIDVNDTDAARRYKAVSLRGSANGFLQGRCSPDGIHWSKPIWESGKVGDATSFFYNPFRDKWGFSIRDNTNPGDRSRARRYWEFKNWTDGAAVAWGDSQKNTPFWFAADRGLEPLRIETGAQPEVYYLDCEAYESLMLGFFVIYRGNYYENNGQGRPFYPGRPKANEIFIGYSRNGWHWSRPDHTPFLGASERRGDWNWGNVRTCAPCCVVNGDQLYIYYNARAGEGYADPEASKNADAGGSTGLAILRRDGFASMDAGAEEATLTTRRVCFGGKYLFVNVDVTASLPAEASAKAGELRAEVLDAQGRPVLPFTREACEPIRVNSTLQLVRWQGAADLSALSGKDVRLRFYLRQGSLYSFWISGTANGPSQGFLAAGGPGVGGFRDAGGTSAYPANRPPWARAQAEPRIAAGPQTVTLDASGSAAADGTIATCAWYEGVHKLAEGVTAKVDLPVGAHDVSLVVTDDRGARGYDPVSISVLPATSSIPPLKDMVMWLKADAIPKRVDGSPVAEWPDASPNRVSAGQATMANRPLWRDQEANGKPCVAFDGVDDWLQTEHYPGLFWTVHKATIFAVFRPGKELQTSTIIRHGWTSFGTVAENGGKLVYRTTVGPVLATTKPGAIAARQWTIGTFVRSGREAGESRLFVNGAEDDDGMAIPYERIGSNYGYIGCDKDKSLFWRGDIAEIIIYADALSDADRKAVESYLGTKYGIKMAGE